LALLHLFASRLSTMCKNAGPNYFAEPNQHVLTFLHPKFAVQCISWVALFADDFLNCMMYTASCKHA
jgi:hypothetical protein